MTTDYPTPGDDYIDSRDVVAAIRELQSLVDDGEATEDDADQLAELVALAVDGETLADWEYGETLIHDDYFETYARELAEDIGAINREYSWPASHIDWEAAADALKMDYTEIDWSGHTYWARP